ncbi:TIR domain-containing protein [Lewinella sp. W8]|uniref:TIR domain-containing protein n=1 Tax=Lewinella sp. W8 TaxID=2528208 RepID=UPI001068227B|nr:TIR domain-containing protein [Lewinella sp. W8]MTB49527.1 TIR domain-containing protein [Lewinella sp. W8]
MKSREDILKLHRDGHMHGVMEALEERLAVEDAPKQHELITLLSQYNSLERNHHLGAVEENDYKTEINRLRLSSYDAIRDLKNVDTTAAELPPEVENKLYRRVASQAPMAESKKSSAPARQRPTPPDETTESPEAPAEEETDTGAHLFISYAREDRSFVDELIIALASLRAKGWISSWTDSDIRGGDEWRPAIETNLRKADIIIYMVSPDFLNSRFIRNTEMVWAEEERASRMITILPVIARPSTWKLEDFSKYNVVPRTDDGVKPISRWEDEDEAYLAVVMELIELVKAIRGREA